MDGQELWQEGGVGPRLTTSCYWLSSPKHEAPLGLFLWCQLACDDASGLLRQGDHGWQQLEVCELASPIQPYPESKRKEICKWDLRHMKPILTHCLAPALSIPWSRFPRVAEPGRRPAKWRPEGQKGAPDHQKKVRSKQVWHFKLCLLKSGSLHSFKSCFEKTYTSEIDD